MCVKCRVCVCQLTSAGFFVCRALPRFYKLWVWTRLPGVCTKVDQITCKCTKWGQVTCICKKMDQITWKTKCEDQITSTKIL